MNNIVNIQSNTLIICLFIVKIKDMTLKFDNLYKEAVGAQNYDTNDPIVAFIANLKKMNNEPIVNEASLTVTPASSRDRKKTFSSINSSDLDSSSAQSSLSSISDLEDNDDEEDVNDDVDDDQEEDKSENESIKAPPPNKNKKFKRN